MDRRPMADLAEGARSAEQPRHREHQRNDPASAGLSRAKGPITAKPGGQGPPRLSSLPEVPSLARDDTFLSSRKGGSRRRDLSKGTLRGDCFAFGRAGSEGPLQEMSSPRGALAMTPPIANRLAHGGSKHKKGRGPMGPGPDPWIGIGLAGSHVHGHLETEPTIRESGLVPAHDRLLRCVTPLASSRKGSGRTEGGHPRECSYRANLGGIRGTPHSRGFRKPKPV